MENIIHLKNDEKMSNSEYSQIKSKKESHVTFWVLLSAFCGLIFVRNILHIEYPIVVLLVFFCLMAFCADHNEIMALAVSCVPLSAAFQYKYALFALIVIYLIKFPRSIKHFNAYIPLALMMIWELMHGLLDFNFSFVEYLRYFAELIFLSFVVSIKNKKIDISLISSTLAVCTIFAGGIGLLKLLAETGYSFESIFEAGYRFGVNDRDAQSYVMNYNPNALGFICNMSICVVLIKGKVDRLSVWNFGEVVVLALLGFLTISRSFLFCLAFIVILFFISSCDSILQAIKTLLIATLFIVFVLLLIKNFTPYIFDSFADRFNVDDISNGRNELMVEYFGFTFSSVAHMLFGIGMQDVLEKVHTLGFKEIEFVPHNGLQELVVVWGILGIVFLVLIISTILKYARITNKRIRVENWIPLLLLLFMIQSGQFITSGQKLLMLTLIYIVFCTKIIREKNDEVE